MTIMVAVMMKFVSGSTELTATPSMEALLVMPPAMDPTVAAEIRKLRLEVRELRDKLNLYSFVFGDEHKIF